MALTARTVTVDRADPGTCSCTGAGRLPAAEIVRAGLTPRVFG